MNELESTDLNVKSVVAGFIYDITLKHLKLVL